MLPQTYDGLRFSADAADCAMPIAVDSHSGCSFSCAYCFSKNLMRNPERWSAKRRLVERLGGLQAEWPLKKFLAFLRRDLKGRIPEAMYPLIDQGQPIQIGALGEPFDLAELESGWMLRALSLIAKLKQPVRISTKGADVILRDEYLDAFREARDYVWVNFSIIHPEDDVVRKIDIGAPPPSRRFEAMKALSEIGVKVGLRYRPALPPLFNKEVDGRPAWQVMIDKAVEAGAIAVSFEWVFLYQAANLSQRRQYRHMSEVMGEPNFPEIWKHHSVRNQACLRANRLYKYGPTMALIDYAHEKGLTVGISDPHFKEMSDSIACCGIPENDPVFGRFSRRCLTTLVVEGRRRYEANGDNLTFRFYDWVPEWASKVRLADMVCLSDADKHMKYKYATFEDKLRLEWNNPSHFRSPYYYFEGILYPVDIDDNKDLIYEYRHWEGQVYKDVEKLKRLRREVKFLGAPKMRSLSEVFS